MKPSCEGVKRTKAYGRDVAGLELALAEDVHSMFLFEVEILELVGESFDDLERTEDADRTAYDVIEAVVVPAYSKAECVYDRR